MMCRVEGSDDVDLSRHFSYYAFEGQSGISRWKHEVSTIYMRTDQCAQVVWGMMGDDLTMKCHQSSRWSAGMVPTILFKSHMHTQQAPKSSCVASTCSLSAMGFCELAESTEGALVQGMDFHRDAEALKNEVVPQHNFKLTANHLEARHYGEVACRDFRESVLAVMPHR